jgi:glycosyltransferase involved in cell wall biosynthesis
MKVSVVIPCHNVEQFISECVESVYKQSMVPFEVICIDNNSTDGTWEELERLKIHFRDLIILKESKPGAPAARNRGLRVARGEWIQFLDADDVLLPEKIAAQQSMLEHDQSVAFIAASYEIVDPNGKLSTFIVEEGNKWEKLIDGSLGCTISNLFSRDLLVKAGGWSENQKSSQEYRLMFDILKIANGHKVLYDLTPRAIYRKRGEGSISSGVRDNLIRYLELREDMWNYLSEHCPSEVEADFYLNAMFQKIRLLYSFDHVVAEAYHKNLIPSGFKPRKSVLTPVWYILLYKIFGFSNVERILNLRKRLIK